MQRHAPLTGFPFALIASPRLGTRSLTAPLAPSLVPSHAFGLTGTAVFVNAMTGNVAVQDGGVCIAELGGELRFAYAYNSLAKQWRFALGNQLLSINAAEIVLVKPDGAQIKYRWSSSESAYVALSAEEGKARIAWNETQQCYEWYDLQSRVYESFNTAGDLIERCDEKGQRTVFRYNASGLLQEVGAASGSIYSIRRDQNSLSVWKDKTQLQRYEFNSAKQVTLSVNADNVATGYCYAADSTLTNIVQANRMQLHFTYENQKINTIGADAASTLTLVYANHQTKLSAKNGYNAELLYSSTVINWRELQLVTTFNLNAAQQVEKVFYPDKTVQVLSYQAQGLLSECVERNGGYSQWFYSNETKPLAVMQLHHADKTCQQLLGGTRFIYSKTSPPRLLFTVSLRGEVTEFNNNAQGLPECEVVYSNALLSLDKQAFCALDEAFMRNFLAGLPLLQRQVTKKYYDAYGRTVEIKHYPLGEGAKECLTEHRQHDMAGRITTRLQDRNAVLQGSAWRTFTAAGALLTDVLGAQPALKQVESIEYVQQFIKRTLPSGLYEVKELDAAGQLVKISQQAGQVLRTTAFQYYQNGNWLEIKKQAWQSGVAEEACKTLQRLDAKKRILMEISAAGCVTVYEYLDAVRCKKTRQFARRIDVASIYATALSGYLAQEQVEPSDTLVNKALTPDEADRETLCFYTIDEKPQYAIDAQGYITEYRYDVLGNELDCIRYAKIINAEERQCLLLGKPLNRLPDRSCDRVVSKCYDADGLLLAEQDEAGYFTVMARDAAGRIIKKQHFLNSNVAYASDLNTLLPKPSLAAATYHYFYDDMDRCTLTIDPENYATINEFEFLAKPMQTIRVAERVRWVDGKPIVQRSTADQATRYDYDELGRTIKITTANGLVTELAYDKTNQITSEIKRDSHAVQWNGDTFRAKRTCFNAFSEQESTMNAFVLLAGQSASDPEAFWQKHANKSTLSAGGLVKAVTDALGHRTLFFYDQDHRLVLTINPVGAARQYERNAFGEVEVERAYALPIPTRELTALSGGLVTPAVLALLKPHSADHTVTFQYDRLGNVTRKQDAEGSITHFKHNAFKECVEEILPPAAADVPPLTMQHAYDPRGMRTKTTCMAEDIGVITSEKRYDHYLGLETDSWDQLNTHQHYARDLLGNCTATWQQAEGDFYYLAKSSSFDAFKRPLVQRAADGEEQQFVYQADGLTTEIKKGNQHRIVRHSVFDEVVEAQEGLGVVEKTTHHPDGSVFTKHNAFGLVSKVRRNLVGDAKSEWHQETGKTRYQRNAARQLMRSIKILSGTKKHVTTLIPNAFGEPETVIDPRGITAEQRYNRRGQLAEKHILPVNPHDKTLSSFYGHTPSGVIVAVDESADNTVLRSTRAQVNSLGQEIKTVLNPADLNIAHSFERDALGNLKKITDENGFITYRYCNIEGRLRVEIVPHTSATVFAREFSYTLGGKLQTVRIHAKQLAKDIFSSSDDLARALSKLTPQPEDGITHYCYDEMGQEIGKIQCVYDPRTNQYQGIVQTKEWDEAGRLVAERRIANYLSLANANPVTTIELRAFLAQNLAQENNRVLRYCYDQAGNKRFAIANDGTGFEYRYDVRGRRIMEIAYGIGLTYPPAMTLQPDPKRDRITYFVHDELGRETHVVAAHGLVTQKDYDAAGNIVATCDYSESIFTRLNPENLIYDDLVASLRCLTPTAAVDHITRGEFDRLNQVILTTDPLGFTDYFERDGLGHLQQHTDRNGAVWRYRTNPAGFLEYSETPSVPVSSVVQAGDGKLQLKTAIERTIANRYELNASGKPKVVLEDYGTDEMRQTLIQRDPAGRIIGTERAVLVNDPTKKASVDFTQLPIKREVVTTRIIYDTQGNKIAECDEEKRWSYYIYDTANRLRFEIHREQAVTEYEYNAFNEKEIIRQYANAPTLDWPRYREKGVTIADLLPALVATPNDRVAVVLRDAAGNPTTTLAPERFFYADNQFGLAKPETQLERNRFGDIIHEKILIRPGVYQETWRWFNTQGKILAQVNAGGYFTRYTRDLQGNETTRTEYANPLTLPITVSTQLADLDASVVVSPKDRAYIFTYSLRNELLTETTQAVTLQAVNVNAENIPVVSDLPLQALTKKHRYNGVGERCATEHPDGLVEGVVRDARGTVLAEIGLPRVGSGEENAAIQIPIKRHHVNSFKGRLATQVYDQAVVDPLANLKAALKACQSGVRQTGANNLFITDNLLFIATVDERGETVILQNSQGDLTANIYSANGKIARHLEVAVCLKGEVGTELMTALDETQMQHNAFDLPIYQGLFRDGQCVQATYTRYNRFCEMNAMSADGQNWVLQQADDNAGIWRTNVSGAVVIVLQDLRGLETLRMQADKEDLSLYSQDRLPDLLVRRAQFECTESRYNLSGQLVQFFVPRNFKENPPRPARTLTPDRWNNILKEIDGVGAVSEFGFNHANQEMFALSPAVRVIDDAGVVSEARAMVRKGYDLRDHLIAEVEQGDNTALTAHYSGLTRAYRVNAAGLKLAVIEADGTISERNTYDIYEHRSSVLDENKQRWIYKVTPEGFIKGGVYPSGRSLIFLLDHHGERLVVRDNANREWRHKTNPLDDVIEKTSPCGDKTQQAFDRNHLPVKIITPDQKTLNFIRDFFGRELARSDLDGRVTQTEFDFCKRPKRIFKTVADPSLTSLSEFEVPTTIFGFKSIDCGASEGPTALQDQTFDYSYGDLTRITDRGLQQIQTIESDNMGRRERTLLTKMNGELIKDIHQRYNLLGFIEAMINEEKMPWGIGRTEGYFLNDIYQNRHYTTLLFSPPPLTAACHMEPWPQLIEHHAYTQRHQLRLLGGQLINGEIKAVANHGLVMEYQGNLRTRESRQAANGEWITVDIAWNEDGRFLSSQSNNGIYVGVRRNDSGWVERCDFNHSGRSSYQDVSYQDELGRVQSGFRADGMPLVVSEYGNDKPGEEVKLQGVLRYEEVIPGTQLARYITRLRQWPGQHGHTESELTQRWLDYHFFDTPQLASDHGHIFNGKPGADNYARLLYDANQQPNAKINAADELLDPDGQTMPDYNQLTAIFLNSPEKWFVHKRALIASQLGSSTTSYLYGFLQDAEGGIYGGYRFCTSRLIQGQDASVHARGQSHDGVTPFMQDRLQICNNYRPVGIFAAPPATPVNDCLNWDMPLLPQLGIKVYTVQAKETVLSIALAEFGDIEAAERIARMNFLPSIYHPLAFGRDIFIPDYVSPYNKAGQTNPLAQFKSQLLSQLAPHLTAPVIKPHRPHTWYKVLIKAIALAIIMAYAPELAPQFLTGLVGAHIATGIVAAVGDAAVQGFCVAANWQKGFSVNEVIETAVTFGTGATGAPLNTLADAAKMALNVAAMNAATQLFEMAIGTSKQFSFQSLALQVTSSLVSAKLNMKGVESESATGLKAALKDGITQTFQAVLGSVLTGQPINVEETLAHSLGNSIGANLQNALKQHFASVSTLEAAKPVQSAPSDATVDATTEASSPHATSQKRQAVQRRAFFERSKAELAALQSKTPSAAEAAKAKAQATRAKRWYDEPQSHARNYDEVLANLNPSDYTLTPASLILKRATAAYFAHFTPLDYAANRAGEIIEAHGMARVKAIGSVLWDASTFLPPVRLEHAVAAMGFKAIGAAKFGVFGLRSELVAGIEEAKSIANAFSLRRTHNISGRLSSQKVADIIKDMRVNGYKGSPIDVVKDDFGNMYIIDGHHRAAAARITATPVTVNIVTDIINHPSSYRSLEEVIKDSYLVGKDKLRSLK